jgi:hypothetical protein
MSDEIRRRHYVMHFDQLCRTLGIEGEAIRIWAENDNDYLHILVNDDTAVPRARGSYVECESVPILSYESTAKEKHSHA